MSILRGKNKNAVLFLLFTTIFNRSLVIGFFESKEIEKPASFTTILQETIRLNRRDLL